MKSLYNSEKLYIETELGVKNNTVSLTVEGASSLEINLSQLAHSSPGGCEENDQGSATRLVCLVNQRERRGGRPGGQRAYLNT